MMTYDSADGYVVMFGGLGGMAREGINEVYHCLNDTWTYRNGVWTNLSRAGPPGACLGAMTYDPVDGYVLAYLAYGSSTSSYSYGWINETWKFVHGTWTEVNVSTEPGLHDPVMTYEPQNGEVLSYGQSSGGLNETWSYSHGVWTQIPMASSPGDQGGNPPKLTYDSADGYALMLAWPSGLQGEAGRANVTWAYENGYWTRMGSFPGINDGTGAMAYDPKDGNVVFFSDEGKAGGPGAGTTWLYSHGRWTNESIWGPTSREGPAMTFDAADGYVLLFGGCWGGVVNNVTSCLHNDSWIYTAPPVGVRLSVSATPARICSRQSEECGAGTDQTRVSIGLSTVPDTGTNSFGLDNGRGAVEYGPFYWVDTPTVTFVGWKNLSPSTSLDPVVTCATGGAAVPTCNSVPHIRILPSGGEELTWNWSGVVGGVSDALRVGDYWNISFNEVALGPPFSAVPIDACSTAPCLAAGENVLGDARSSLSFSPYGNSTQLVYSLPLGTVSVLPPGVQSSSPPSTPPGAPPPAVTAPLPLPTPPAATPGTISTPVATPAPAGSLATTLSETGLGAGILTAGLARVALARRTHALRIANQVGLPAARRLRSRGED